MQRVEEQWKAIAELKNLYILLVANNAYLEIKYMNTEAERGLSKEIVRK